MKDGIEQRAGSAPGERKRTRGHFVQHSAKRKNVGSRIDILAQRLLGRHVCDRAERSARAGEMFLRKGGLSLPRNGRGAGIKLRETEVENLSVTSASDENVGGLDIAMDDIFEMSGIECIRHVNGEREKRLDLQRTICQRVFQCLAIEILHHDEGAALVIADFIDCANVRMIQCGSRTRFTAEAL